MPIPDRQRLTIGPWQRRWRTSLGFLAIALFMAATTWPKWLSAGGPGLTLSEARQALFALILLPIGGWLTWIDITGRPKLIFGRRRLVCKGLFWTQAVRWERLGAFYLVKAGAIKSRKLFSARAPLLRLDNEVVSRGKFRIDDNLAEPMSGVLREIAKRIHVHMRWPEEPRIRPDCGVQGALRPWCSLGLPLLFILPYTLEWFFPAAAPVQGSIAPETMTAFGGTNLALIGLGQWYRLLVSPFLHAGWLHIVADTMALALAARLAERLIGWGWTSLLFLAGNLLGSVAIYWHADAADPVLVGGSGGVVAILACLWIAAFRMPRGRLRLGLHYRLTEIAVPALIPLSPDAAAVHISNVGVLFGGVVGAGAGALLLATWKPRDLMPRFAREAAWGAAVLGVCVVLAAGFCAFHYRDRSLLDSAIPADRLPKAGASLAKDATALTQEFPNDPRPHLYLSAIALKKKDKAGAEREARLALALLRGRSSVFSPAVAQTAEALLATVLFDEGKKDDAAALATPLCNTAEPSLKSSAIYNRLVQDRLCAGPLPPVVAPPAHTRAGVPRKHGL